MATVYILHSKILNRFYIGSFKDLSFRLEQHLNKVFENSFTSKVRDWTLFYHIENLEYKQARLIEQHIKQMKSSVYIRNLKKYPDLKLKLIDKYKY